MLALMVKIVRSPLGHLMLYLFGVLALVAGLLASRHLGDGAASAPPSAATRSILLGSRELVRMSAADGTAIDVVAKVDTGAVYSSIDTGLAKALGLDLKNADRVTISSSLGEERRPIVPLRLVVAGRIIDTRVTVNDRSERSTNALLGARDLDGFLVDVSREEWTSVTGPVAPSPINLLKGATATIDTLRLLATVPLAAVVVVGLRTLIGLLTFGLFAPLLLAVSLVQTGMLPGLLIFGAMLGVGLLSQPALRPLRLPRVARLAVLLAIVIVTMLVADRLVGPSAGGQGGGGMTALPVLVTATIIEQFWNSWEQHNLRAALNTTLWTLLVAVVVSLVLVSAPVWEMADRFPLALALGGAALSVVVGRYRGLRLLELIRFVPVAEAVRVRGGVA